MAYDSQQLSVTEKIGYSLGDAAANFVFMTMILFQANFYTDVMGIAAGTAGVIILVARLWDAFFDPLMGVLADRTRSRWGRFRPWILFTAVPWGIATVLAYSTPSGWSPTSIVVYALVTNILLMTLYSANNMPYAALGGVMTGDVEERARLNSYRFVAVNLAQLAVGGFTLPLVAKFADALRRRRLGPRHRLANHDGDLGRVVRRLLPDHVCDDARTHRAGRRPQVDAQAGFRRPVGKQPVDRDVRHDAGPFRDSLAQGRGLLQLLPLLCRQGRDVRLAANVASHCAAAGRGRAAPAGILEFLGYVVHADRSNLANSNVADVANSVINILEKIVFIIVIICSPLLSRKFGKKAIAVVGFALTAIVSALFYLPKPTDIGWMVALTVIAAITYGPTIPLLWAMFADVADYSEWKTGRRATGIIFATIGFALKAGLSLGAYLLLTLLAGYGYQANAVQSPQTLEGIRLCSSIIPAVLFAVCTVLLAAYKINKRLTIQIADDLAARRAKAIAS